MGAFSVAIDRVKLCLVQGNKCCSERKSKKMAKKVCFTDHTTGYQLMLDVYLS